MDWQYLVLLWLLQNLQITISYSPFNQYRTIPNLIPFRPSEPDLGPVQIVAPSRHSPEVTTSWYNNDEDYDEFPARRSEEDYGHFQIDRPFIPKSSVTLPAYHSAKDTSRKHKRRYTSEEDDDLQRVEESDHMNSAFVGLPSSHQDQHGNNRLLFHISGHQGPHSYRFGYDTGKGHGRQFRFEERDNHGQVKGQYGFYDSTGKLQVVNYSADPEHGYEAKGNFGQFPVPRE